MIVLANCQLAIDNYIDKLSNKLTEVESKRLTLRDMLAITEEKLKGSETALERARDQLKGRRMMHPLKVGSFFFLVKIECPLFDLSCIWIVK